MQSENDLDIDPPYDPDDWGAPLPKSTPRAATPPELPSPAYACAPALEGNNGGSPSPQNASVEAGPSDAGNENAHAAAPIGPEPTTEPRARRRGPARVAASGPTLQLPHAEKVDLIPAIFSSSALFRVGGSDDLPAAAPASAPPIAVEAQGTVNMTLSGPWPRMRDKAVWEIALEMAKASSNAADPILVNLSEFASRMGYADKGGDTLEWIWASLRRLSFCHVEFNSPSAAGPRLAGKLLLAARETAGRKEIEIDPAFAARLLGEDFQFATNRARRATLSTALARWLHDFLSTHATQDRPFDLPYLRNLCGYGADKRRFPAELNSALADLVGKAPEVLESYSIGKPTRSSDGWTVALVCGGEKRRFERPNPLPKPAGPARTGGRGGVAL